MAVSGGDKAGGSGWLAGWTEQAAGANKAAVRQERYYKKVTRRY
jgi:hypothetical protein